MAPRISAALVRHLFAGCLTVAVGNVAISQGPPGRSAGRPVQALHEGLLPDANAFTGSGKPVKLRELTQGSYCVLKTGCLTCPEFHRSYGEVEAAYADYQSKGVKFFYIYQSLRHPELGGYVQAQNIQERLLQMSEAQAKLQTKAPWIADTIDDSVRVSLKSSSQSVFLVSPEGQIVYAADRLTGSGLRDALTKFVGPVDKPTLIRDLDLPALPRHQRQANVDTDLLVSRPEGLVIVSTTPAMPGDTYYVKLRAEAEPALLETGTGRLFLGFYPDPIHDAHWNNLSPPMKYVLDVPVGMNAAPAEKSAKKGPGNSDTNPRQFWVNIESNLIPDAGKEPREIKLTLHYYACTDTMCEALTHQYTITFVPEDKNSRTFGFNRGPQGSGRGRPQGNRGGRMQRVRPGARSGK